MLKLVNSDQMRRIDEITIRERGIAGSELMERAGREVAREVMERFSPGALAIVTGKGNNGGDGFVAARHLHQMGVSVFIFALADAAELRGEARDAFDKMPSEIVVEKIAEAGNLGEKLREFDVVIDAIFGTGLRGPVKGLAAEVIDALNRSQVPILSIDVPSGLLAEAAQPAEISGGPSVRAAVTITIGLPKLGLVVDPGMRSCGVVSIADIGFPRDLLEDTSISINLLGMEDMAALLPPRDPSGHKGTFGKPLILAGSEGMTGAAVLTARAAVRSGVGLVYSAYPRPLTDIMESHLIEPVKRPLPGEERWFTKRHAESALREAEEMDAVALGPGLGQRSTTAGFVREMIRSVRAPMIIDADGLNAIASNPRILKERPGPTVLTPHPGEAARLLNISIAEVQANRLEACLDLARDTGVVVVLKGAQTVITAPDGQRYINPTGNSGLAKGGSGDVLTGLIAGLLAQGCSALAAAQLGVFLHGLAADRAAKKNGVRALTPSDVIDHLGSAFLFLERREED